MYFVPSLGLGFQFGHKNCDKHVINIPKQQEDGMRFVKKRQIEKKKDKNKFRVKKNKGILAFHLSANHVAVSHVICLWLAPCSYDTTHSTISLFDWGLLQCEVLHRSDLFLLLFLLGSLSIIEINKGNRLRRNVCCLSHRQMFLQGETRLSVQDWVQERCVHWVPSIWQGKTFLSSSFLGLLILEYGTDTLSRNVGKELPLCAA